MRSTAQSMSFWQRTAVIVGITLGYLGVAVFGVAAMFEFINVSTIILGLLLIGAGVLVAHVGALVRLTKHS